MSIDDEVEATTGPGFIEIRNKNNGDYARVEVDQAGNLLRASGAAYLLRLLNEEYGILGVVANLKKDKKHFR
ncbi:MAG: hypothetical protein QXT19_05120 [Candidatus Woesearchaeota archaeon]